MGGMENLKQGNVVARGVNEFFASPPAEELLALEEACAMAIAFANALPLSDTKWTLSGSSPPNRSATRGMFSVSRNLRTNSALHRPIFIVELGSRNTLAPPKALAQASPVPTKLHDLVD